MTASDGYALDLLSPVRHVATEMERAGSDGPALTIWALAASYQHTTEGDLARICEDEGAANNHEARLWLIDRAVTELGGQVKSDGEGFRLAKPFEELKYKGRKLRRVVRAGEESEKETLRAVYHNLDKELRPFHVTVAGARGAENRVELTLHPLAHAIPRMSEKEFADLAGDVKANGVRLPITVMGGRVIDGRHRLAVASALNIPVRVEQFTGTEDDARHHIVSLNLVRRHLNMAQRALIVRQIFLPEAEAEAEERLKEAGQGHGRGQDSLAPDGATLSGPAPTGASSDTGKKATEVAAERSMGLASARSIERMAPVDDAPETQERIRSGEIKSTAEARREALKETGEQAPEDVGVLQPRSALRHLTCARRDAERACEDVDTKDGDVPYEELRVRVAEIRAHLDRLDKLLQADPAGNGSPR